MTRPLTYEDIWQRYAAGKLPTCLIRGMLKRDEVFRQWCIRRAADERRQRDRQHNETA